MFEKRLSAAQEASNWLAKLSDGISMVTAVGAVQADSDEMTAGAKELADVAKDARAWYDQHALFLRDDQPGASAFVALTHVSIAHAAGKSFGGRDVWAYFGEAQEEIKEWAEELIRLEKASVTTSRPDGCLVLEDGSVFRGQRMGDPGTGWGEVVFNTSMTGYQEMLTDPSYAGQILVLTYPLIGNYGVIPPTDESARIQVRGLVVRSDCDRPSHPLGGMTVDAYLRESGTPGLAGVDTRAITRRIRERGVMQGLIVAPEEVELAKARLAELPEYDSQDFIEVGTREAYGWDGAPSAVDGDGPAGADRPHIVVLDEGLKYNILRMLRARGCRVTAAPPETGAADVLAMRPDGVLLSPGPGDPQFRDQQVEAASGLLGRVPLMGICLGHQVIGRALGAGTFKLKFGHRGGNHPVKDLITGSVAITAQNHGYAVDPDGLRGGAAVSHVNLHDDTVEGLTHSEYPLVSIQYHSEASPGPLDNAELFDRFLDLVREGAS